MAKHSIDWAETAQEWADEVAALKETEGVDSREYRLALQNLRSAERHRDAENERQAERDKYDDMTPRQVGRAVVDRLMDSGR